VVAGSVAGRACCAAAVTERDSNAGQAEQRERSRPAVPVGARRLRDGCDHGAAEEDHHSREMQEECPLVLRLCAVIGARDPRGPDARGP
jgi:hypothetical protein